MANYIIALQIILCIILLAVNKNSTICIVLEKKKKIVYLRYKSINTFYKQLKKNAALTLCQKASQTLCIIYTTLMNNTVIYWEYILKNNIIILYIHRMICIHIYIYV